jgi:hypothetical protein
MDPAFPGAAAPSGHLWSPRHWWHVIEQNWESAGPVTRDERQGYYFWLPTIGTVLLIEVLGATTSWFGGAIPWPTLSMTVGHLENLWPLTAVLVVAVIAAALFQTLAFRNKPGATVRGRMRRRGAGDPVSLDWYGWWFVLSLTVASFFLAWLAGAGLYQYGYAIYGTVLGLGFVVPSLLLFFGHRLVAFPTLFSTASSLQKRLHFVTLILATGLVVLAVHLAFYPWPDITHESGTYAGRNAAAARSHAEDVLASLRSGRTQLAFSTTQRGVVAGVEAWYVYFLPGCVVVETKSKTTTSSACAR